VDHSCVKIHAYMGGGDMVQGWRGIEQLEMNILWTIGTSLKAESAQYCAENYHGYDPHHRRQNRSSRKIVSL